MTVQTGIQSNEVPVVQSSFAYLCGNPMPYRAVLT